MLTGEVFSSSLRFAAFPADAMVVTPIKLQRLAARDDSEDGGKSGWGTIQIATPVLVGGVLLLLFAAYIIWQRRPYDRRPDDYRQVRSDWATKLERMFVPRRKRQRVLHSSVPVTLDGSMRTSGHMFDFSQRSRQSRSNSSDSQTPLTCAFDYPPSNPSVNPPNMLSDLSSPSPMRPPVRWWWPFGSRPQQIKSEEPNHRWRIDDTDGSSSGHGHPSHGHRYARALEPLREGPEDTESDVIRIGNNFSSVASAPMTQHLPEQARFVRGIPTVPENPRSGTHTPVPAPSAPHSNPGTPVPSANRGLPPSYDVSQSQTRYPSTERLVRSGPYMTIPPPVRTAVYPSPHAFHGRDLSSDSFLATQPPMVATSMY